MATVSVSVIDRTLPVTTVGRREMQWAVLTEYATYSKLGFRYLATQVIEICWLNGDIDRKTDTFRW